MAAWLRGGCIAGAARLGLFGVVQAAHPVHDDVRVAVIQLYRAADRAARVQLRRGAVLAGQRRDAGAAALRRRRRGRQARGRGAGRRAGRSRLAVAPQARKDGAVLADAEPAQLLQVLLLRAPRPDASPAPPAPARCGHPGPQQPPALRQCAAPGRAGPRLAVRRDGGQEAHVVLRVERLHLALRGRPRPVYLRGARPGDVCG